MSSRLFLRLRALRRDSRGASLIEFALFAPILAFMVMGVTDVAMGYSQRLTMEAAAYRALEKVAVGSVKSDYSNLRTEAAAADGPGGIQDSDVTVDNWLECDRVRQADFNGICPDGQMVSRYVEVTVRRSFRPRFSYGPLGRAFGGRASDGSIPLTAAAALRVQ